MQGLWLASQQGGSSTDYHGYYPNGLLRLDGSRDYHNAAIGLILAAAFYLYYRSDQRAILELTMMKGASHGG